MFPIRRMATHWAELLTWILNALLFAWKDHTVEKWRQAIRMLCQQLKTRRRTWTTIAAWCIWMRELYWTTAVCAMVESKSMWVVSSDRLMAKWFTFRRTWRTSWFLSIRTRTWMAFIRKRWLSCIVESRWESCHRTFLQLVGSFSIHRKTSDCETHQHKENQGTSMTLLNFQRGEEAHRLLSEVLQYSHNTCFIYCFQLIRRIVRWSAITKASRS